MNFRRSVCIGKFLPPHRGHHLLIDTAQERSEHVTVIVCEKPSDSIPGELRAAWLREIHPRAEVLRIDDTYDADDDSELWARLTIGWLGGAPDAVFTSENYGDAYARAMGCVHVLVDRERLRMPCSGTAIRSDPFAMWEYLAPPVRAWFAKRVCVLGAESTGTTTLARALAEQFRTTWVAEYGREYSEEKLRRGDAEWRSEEFLRIAREQTRREELAAREANRVLVCDTNSFATALWHRRYVGFDCAELWKLGRDARCDLYLLTGDEIPFVQDGLRDGEDIRHEMHRWFADELDSQERKWALLSGPHEERLQRATKLIESLFSDRA